MANFNPLSDTTGAKYIKIPRIDANGRDNTIRLQELRTIRIKFSDIGVVEFFIQSISEFSDYYLYRVSRSTAVNSTDDNQVLNYDFEGRKNSRNAGQAGAGEFLPTQDQFWEGSKVGGYDTVPTDERGYFNQTTGVYLLGDYPNISLTASFSGNVGQQITEPGAKVYAAVLLNGSPVGGAEGPINQNSSFDFSRSFTINQNDNISFGIAAKGGLSPNIPVTRMTGSLTQSIDPVTATEDLIVLDPSFDVKFNGSNCDVLYGNVDGTAINTFYMDVDYAYQQSTPINFQQILSGSATKAEISNYNYEAKHLTLPRYEGSRSTALRVNTYTQPQAAGAAVINELGQTILGYEGDTNTLGRTSTVDDTRAYFGYFDYIGGTAPELFNKVQVKLKYIVGEDGRSKVPILGTPPYYNVLGTFESQDTAVIELRDPTAFEVNMSALQGKKEIFKPGVRVEPILYSQSGSSPYGTDNSGNPVSVPFYSLTFNKNQNPLGVQIYSLQAGKTPANGSDSVPLGTPDVVEFDLNNTPTEFTDLGYTYSTSTYTYTVNTSGGGNPKTKIRFTSLVLVETLEVSHPNGNGPKFSGTFYLEILKNGTDVVAQQPLTVYSDGEAIQCFVNTGFINVTNGDTFKVQYYYVGDAGLDINEVRGTSSPNNNFQPYFKAQQQIGTAASASYYQGVDIPSTVVGYWDTGASSRTVLTSSAQLGNLYGVKFDGKDDAPFFSGFNAIRDEFTIERGDEFRFEANEALVHQVTDVEQANGKIYVTVFPAVSSDTDTDSFLLRRYVQDATSVLLNTDKPGGATSDGFIKPEYLSSVLEENIDTISGQILDQNP